MQNAGTSEEEKTNILDLSSPTQSNTDDLIEFLYSLIGSNYERLTPLDGEQELILALGEDETEITLGEEQTIHFSNLAHLASLLPEDYLTMRLYTNNDAGNILWEYAFGEAPSMVPDVVYISADNPTLEMGAYLSNITLDIPKNTRMRWVLESPNGSMQSAKADSSIGVFPQLLRADTVAGTTCKRL